MTVRQVRALQNNAATLDRFTFLPFQLELLRRWDEGFVQCDWNGVPPPDRTITPEGLTRAALDGTVGARLHPGIEGGRMLTRSEIYMTPFAFRLSHDVIDPGDVTAYMALPWQADFWKCRLIWWPSHRPDIVRASRATGDVERWENGVASHLDMAHSAMKLGMVRPRLDAHGETIGMIEEGRDTASLPPRT
jgi:hypothetical protein